MKVSKEVAHGYSIEAAKRERGAETSRQWLSAAQAWANVVSSAPDDGQTEYAMHRYMFCVQRLMKLEAWDELCILGEV